jgi:hypothetical protein
LISRALSSASIAIPPCGAGDRNRTRNLLFTKQLLCQLSYAGVDRKGSGTLLGGGWRADLNSDPVSKGAGSASSGTEGKGQQGTK